MVTAKLKLKAWQSTLPHKSWMRWPSRKCRSTVSTSRIIPISRQKVSRHPDGQLPEPDAQNSVNEAGDHAEPYPEPPQEGAHGQFAGDHIADPASAVDGGQ